MIKENLIDKIVVIFIMVTYHQHHTLVYLNGWKNCFKTFSSLLNIFINFMCVYYNSLFSYKAFIKFRNCKRNIILFEHLIKPDRLFIEYARFHK